MYNDSIKRVNLEINKVPITVFRPNTNEKLKTIIHYHGWSSSAEKYELMGQIFALHGIQFVLVEIDKHGVRGTADYSTFYESPGVMVSTFKEFEDIKEALIERLDIDRKHFGISGHSLGGMIASSIFARHEDLKLAVIYNSTMDFSISKYLISDESLREKMKKEGSLYENNEYDPMKYLDNLDSRHMYIAIGDLDNVIPPKFMEEVKEKLKDSGINMENMIFENYMEASHSITYRMVNTALEYVLENL